MNKTASHKLGIMLAGVLAITPGSASAAIVFDLKASAVDGSLGTLLDGKIVFVTGATGKITFQVWAQITNEAPTTNIFGIQQIMGSIVSTTNAGTATGTMAASTPAAPFNVSNTVGAVAQLSSPADSVTDLGSNLTTPSSNYIKFRKDTASGGEQLGGAGIFYATNNAASGATFSPITNGYEFLMGTATLSLTSFTAASLSMNWKIPTFTLASLRSQIATWTDGDGIANNGNTQFTEMSAGNAVTVVTQGVSHSGPFVPFGNYSGIDASGQNHNDEDANHASFVGANLSNVSWDLITLSFANLSYANLSNARGNSANLTGANLHNADLRNSSSLVRGFGLAADVTGVNLSGNDLSGFALAGINLSGADLSSANLASANFGFTNLSGTNLSGANLNNANFNSTNLSGAMLTTSLLRYADFTGANLSGTTLGDGTRFDGFIYEGRLDIGAGTTTLNSLAFANLGTLTTIAGGTLTAPNGVSLGVGRSVVGAGAVNGKVAGTTGSTIFATGNLALGNASSPVGFTTDGELYTGTNAVTLNDSNQAVLGSLTQLGSGGVSGTLNATHGLYVDFGRNLVGQGTVNSNNALADAVIINGSAQGTGIGLLFTGYVKGQGTFSGSVTFGGTYSPGLSPASVYVQDVSLLSSSTLVLELGGITAGSQYDQINVSGTATLDGTLDLELIYGFVPALGNTFDLFNGTLEGVFDTVNLPTLGAGLAWDTSQLTQNGTVSVVPEPSSLALLGLSALGMSMRRRKVKSLSGSQVDAD